MKKIFFLSLSFFIICIYDSSFAQIPKVISYQGILTDTAGIAKPDGLYNFTFLMYEASSGGNALWSESKKLNVKNGLFSTNLGDNTPFGNDVKFDKPCWLSIQIESDAELPSRIMLTPTAYSISSINSDTAEYAKQFNIDNGQVVRSINGLKDNITLKGLGGTAVTTNGDTITIAASGGGSSGGISAIQNTDNTLSISNPTGPTTTINLHSPFIINSDVGIGVNSPAAKLDVNGGSGSGANIGVHGSSNDNYGIYGTSNNNYGLFGESAGWIGVYARTYASGTYALLAGNGAGNKNYCGLASGNYSIFANGPAALSTVGIGTEPDQDPAGFKLKIKGSASFDGGSSTSINVGVSGSSAALFAGNYFSIGGISYINTSVGLASENYAVEANGSSYFNGDVHVSGSIGTTANLLIIDNPVDPANKYLIHSSVESPDMKNIYDGVVTTDANGSAVVYLPSYFQALNIDYRYQLTVIGQFAQAIIESKIQNNRFTIRSDKPNVEVSWQVTGIRNDAYAKANPSIVEMEKPGHEKGKYLSPESFGQPKESGIHYVKNPPFPFTIKNKKE
jgi:hypothetical protein